MDDKALTHYKKNSGKNIVIISLSISILAIIITSISFSYFYFNNKYLQQRLVDYKSLVADEIKNETQKLQNSFQEQENTFNLKTQELLNKANNLLEKTSSQESTWTLSEIDYLLLAGERQLKLFHDKISAINYFENANNLAHSLQGVKFTTIADSIQKDLIYIKDLAFPDKSQLISQIRKLSEKINTSVLAKNNSEKKDEPKTNQKKSFEFKNLLDKNWWLSLFNSQYKIYHAKGPNKILLTIQEQQQIKQIITNYLEEAELAVLQNNQFSYQQYLSNATQWLNRYKLFEQEYTTDISNKLTELKAINFSNFNEDNLLSPKLVKQLIVK